MFDNYGDDDSFVCEDDYYNDTVDCCVTRSMKVTVNECVNECNRFAQCFTPPARFLK